MSNADLSLRPQSRDPMNEEFSTTGQRILDLSRRKVDTPKSAFQTVGCVRRAAFRQSSEVFQRSTA